MKENVKFTSITQAVWRENKRIKEGSSRCRIHLEEQEIKEIRDLRERGNTLSYIAKKFNRSIRTIEKQTIGIEKIYSDFDKNYGKGGNHTGHSIGLNHPWRKLNNNLFY